MQGLSKFKVSKGIYWVEVPEADVRILCGCPADAIKHLTKRGFIIPTDKDGVNFETGPNAILLSDVLLQHGSFSNLAEFPILHMIYKQGMGLPDHPNNIPGIRPLIIGLREQVTAQLRYIYRGNFGLTSKEELLATGADSELVDELMEFKLQFAFGKIKQPHEYIDTLLVNNDRVEIRNGVYIKRLRVNEFEISYRDEVITVDLNLKVQESYEPPYPLGFYNTQREFFAVLHTGDGDGWDEDRPCMSSIVMFHGKIYLIDMGPNLPYSLKSLGISVNEIEGVFHTHAHDDHFVGITTLIRGDHKIKYYASPLVREAVCKKLAALLSIDENNFYDFFDVHDLELNTWNDIEDLEVMPVISPHPVETNIFKFRTLAADGYRSYSHLADTISLDSLRQMIRANEGEPGISKSFYDSVCQCYLEPANIKKVDIGGGMIHGDVEDFRNDQSDRVILSHTSRPLTSREKEIGCFVPFGIVDVLIDNYSEFYKRVAYQYLNSYYPHASRYQLRGLLNNRLVTFNPGVFILREGEKSDGVYLILTGNVEINQAGSDVAKAMTAGGMIGDMSGLYRHKPESSYRASSYVQAMFFPERLYLEFINKNQLREQTEHLNERRKFLQQTPLFGDVITFPVQNRIAQALQEHTYQAGECIDSDDLAVLNIIVSGSIECSIGKDVLETIKAFEVFGGDQTYFSTTNIFNFTAHEETNVYRIEGEDLKDIPIVRWKLIEMSEKRRRRLLNIQPEGESLWQWRDEYKLNIEIIDQQHRNLFDLSNSVMTRVNETQDFDLIEQSLQTFREAVLLHFAEEESLLQEYDYPELSSYCSKNQHLLDQFDRFNASLNKDQVINELEFVHFFNDWLMQHILIEDRRYGLYINQLISH